MTRSNLISLCGATAAAIVLTAVGTAARAAQPEGCPRFLPDFSCDRQGRYPGFIPPTSMPYLFEDPFITSGLSAHGVWHAFPWDSAFRGGDAWVVALQARIAITDRLAFIATKDGYTWLRPGSSSQISAEEGFFDISAGFKYALIDRPEDNFIFTPSLRFDVPTGEKAVFSGNGDGVAIPAFSTAWGLDWLHFIGDLGARLPFDTNKESSSLFYNLHIDASPLDFLVPFVELNGTTWLHSGKGERNVKTKAFGSVDLTAAQDVLYGAGVTDTHRWEGGDLVNLGSRGVAGNTILTLAIGSRIPVTKHLSIGGYYEFPVTRRDDIFEQRAAVNALYEF